jgi:glucose-6-phosphate-specific signal transduction histidine kinase
MDWLFKVMAIFIEHPLLAAAIGLLLVGLGRWTQRGVAMTAGVLWLMYSLWEFAIKQRWLCSGDCDIRADLIFIYPVLFVVSVAAVVSLLIKPRRPQAGS